jgi:histidine ammonia-lyase
VAVALDHLAVADVLARGHQRAAHRAAASIRRCRTARVPARRRRAELGVHDGHVTAAALVSENKVLAHPASVDTIPRRRARRITSRWACTPARKAAQIVRHARPFCASSARGRAGAGFPSAALRPGRGVAAAHRAFRAKSPRWIAIRYLAPDIEAARRPSRTKR